MAVGRERQARGRSADAATPAEQLERRWLERAAVGDRDAFEKIYSSYYPRLLAYLHRMLGSGELAEEVVDDVLLAVWKGADRFRGRSKVSTWIFGIAYRQGMKAHRHRRRRRLLSGPELPEEIAGDDSPQRDLDRAELRARLSRGLAQLSARHRAVVLLTFVEGRSYQEIAEIVGCPVNTVKTRMFHARRRLQRLLRTARAGGGS